MRASNLGRQFALACAFLLLATGAWAQGSASAKNPNNPFFLSVNFTKVRQPSPPAPE